MNLKAIPGALVAAALSLGSAAAQEAGAGLYAPSAWDLVLGSHASELPSEQFIRYACGTNGGPASRPLPDWTGFGQCRPEASGLREVYFQYDNELEYISKARGLVTQVALYQYTSAYEIPIIVSGLFDEDGFLIGIRMVTDPRVPVALRERGRALSNFLMARYGEGWTCIDLPALPGEQPYQGSQVKRRCELDLPAEGQHIVLEAHNYRRAGQTAIDPVNNIETAGQFESTTRFELTLSAGIDDREARLAAIAARPEPPPTEKELLIARALDCPGCDFHEADFKRADLTNARLAGANLAGVNLHEANLTGADLSGAILDGANINHAILLRANLAGASVNNVMLFETRLDGADLTDASLRGALAASSHMPRAVLAGIVMIDGDLRNARINDADFTGADLRGTWFDDAQIMRSDFSEALLSQTTMWGANLTGANLSGADLRYADLIRANLRGADLTGADLSDARLTFANLSEATLTGAVLDNAQMPGGFTPPP